MSGHAADCAGCGTCARTHGDQADPEADELARMRGDRDIARESVDRLAAEAEALQAQRDAARAEVERLKALSQDQALDMADLLRELQAARAEAARLKERRFPILQGGPSIPWRLIEPHGRQALANHSQTLERLAERGGLGPCEALAVLEDRPWRLMDPDVAHDLLSAYAGWVAPEIHELAKAEAEHARRERDAIQEQLEAVSDESYRQGWTVEREACAKLADDVERVCPGHGKQIAAAIRARGSK